MATDYDATTKQLIALNPQDWLDLLGFSGTRVQVVDADLATVTTDADRVLHILDSPERLIHIEFESGKDARRVPIRLSRYNTLLGYSHNLPVASVVVLLNPCAGGLSEVTGTYEQQHPDIGTYITFRYNVIRIWEVPVEQILSAGIATLPLSLLGNLSGRDPAQVVGAVNNRLVSDGAVTEEAREILFASAYILSGLRFNSDRIRSLFQGIHDMEESSTYQAILKQGLAQGITQGLTQGITQGITQGRVQEAQEVITELGSKRFGRPSADVAAIVQATQSLARLQQLRERLLDAQSWTDLLAS